MTSIQPTAYASIAIVRLGRGEWRVSAASEDGQLLGYIERQRADRFEIVWITEPMRWGYATTFDEALLAFGDSTRFTGEIFTQRAEDLDAHPHARAESSPRAHLPRRSTWIKSGGRSSVA